MGIGLLVQGDAEIKNYKKGMNCSRVFESQTWKVSNSRNNLGGNGYLGRGRWDECFTRLSFNRLIISTRGSYWNYGMVGIVGDMESGVDLYYRNMVNSLTRNMSNKNIKVNLSNQDIAGSELVIEDKDMMVGLMEVLEYVPTVQKIIK